MLSEIKFQYILCYGSTHEISMIDFHHTNFNTSYVTVQHLYARYSPHCLLNFNTSYVTVQQYTKNPSFFT